ncbi:clathrin heavy chain, partial [Reticulomyxa filosa]
MFLAVSDVESGGVLTVDRSGQVISFNIDEKNFVNYVTEVVGDAELGEKFAELGFFGGDEVLQKKFDSLLRQGNFTGAVEMAAKCPALRNDRTIAALKQVPPQPNQPPPDLQYYQLLLKQGSLNKLESVELCRRILQFKPDVGKQRIEQFLKEDKLEKSEELGDALAPFDVKLAAAVYYGANIPQKTILCFIQLGQASRVIEYCKQANYTPKWPDLLAYVHQMRRDDVKEFAQSLIDQSFLSAADVMNVLLGGGRNDVEKTPNFCLITYEIVATEKKMPNCKQNYWKSICELLHKSPKLFWNQKTTNSLITIKLILQNCVNPPNLEDIKRVLQMGLGSNAFKPDFLLQFFGDLTPEDALSCLKDLLKYSSTGTNLQLVVEVAKRYSEQLTVEKLIQLFQDFEWFVYNFYFFLFPLFPFCGHFYNIDVFWSGLYLYLGSMVNSTENADVVFKYIQAAAEVGQVAQIELICRENNHYDPDKVKAFLLESNKIKDPRPLIHVCDRHGYVDELTSYLYTNQLYRFIEVYVQRMNPGATPKVVGSLIDLNAPEDQIRNLINSVRPPQCPVKELVEEVEKRVRLTLLLPWLESRFHEGLEDAALHNALAKIYIDINNNPQHFLMNNKFYDSMEVGQYCESRDPHLAFIAYKRAWGKCDKELVNITNKHGFFKDQARYCVERQDADLWALVLAEQNEQRRSLIDQVVSTALPESRNPDEVSNTVKAFMAANLPNELIELLERIVLSNSADYNFRNNKNLQNLLILTAIKADSTRVAGYVERLDNFDGPDLANICISEQYKLYEEGFLIYKKFKKGLEAAKVLLENLKDIERGTEFAQYWDKPE